MLGRVGSLAANDDPGSFEVFEVLAHGGVGDSASSRQLGGGAMAAFLKRLHEEVLGALGPRGRVDGGESCPCRFDRFRHAGNANRISQVPTC